MFNDVDTTYQARLRELNEINFARFDAKLERRLAGVEGQLARFERRIDARIGILEKRIDGLTVALERKTDMRFTRQPDAVPTRIPAYGSRMIRWMIALWCATNLTIVGLIIALFRAG